MLPLVGKCFETKMCVICFAFDYQPYTAGHKNTLYESFYIRCRCYRQSTMISVLWINFCQFFEANKRDKFELLNSLHFSYEVEHSELHTKMKEIYCLKKLLLDKVIIDLPESLKNVSLSPCSL